jgi:energy-coupling factor transport system substrate-specific component
MNTSLLNRKLTAKLPLLKKWWFISLLAVVCGFINFGLSRLGRLTTLPLYADSIATIVVSVYFGILHGILTAGVTNAMLAVFGPVPFPFVLCNIATALIAGYFARKSRLESIGAYLWMGLWISLANGLLGSIISIMVFGGRIEGTAIDSLTMGFYITLDSYFPAVVMAGLVTNLLDKMVSVFLVFLLKPVLAGKPLIEE